MSEYRINVRFSLEDQAQRSAAEFFYKHKILLPLLPFYRTIRAMKAGRFQSEAKAIKNAKVSGRKGDQQICKRTYGMGDWHWTFARDRKS